MMIGLTIILILVLFLPFTVKVVERNLEVFLFIMGILAAIISGVLDFSLILKALEDPIYITLAVLAAGLLFRWFQTPIENGIRATSRAIPQPVFIAVIVIVLGLISSIITAIIAAIVLVTIVSVLDWDRKAKILFVILTCYSIGIGAVLTPIGEPLSTIAVSKLNQDFFYLFRLLGVDVIIAVIAVALFAAFYVRPKVEADSETTSQEQESYAEIIIRSLKIYLFVMALTFLGAGFEPFIERYLLHLSPEILYWINMVSAILDNATLAAAEISPAMTEETIRAILFGLLISGGMLIPGNIPNIIAAGKLNITSSEWARFAFPFGLVAMLIGFIFVVLI